MLKFLKDIIAPKKCYSCNKEGHFLCIKCLSMMSNFDSICYVCKGKSNNFDVHEKCLGYVYYDKVIILSHYKNKVISKLIKDFKFYGRKDIGEDFGIYLTNMFFDNEVYKNTDNYIILYPPMGFFKSLKRGYNHSKFLAKVISTETGIKLENTMLKKVRQTGQQSKLSRQERLNNLQDSFKIHKNKIDNIDKKIFIVIDDVISTGSTLNEISRVLKHAGAKKVIGLIVASD